MTREQADEMVDMMDRAIAGAMGHCRVEGGKLVWTE